MNMETTGNNLLVLPLESSEIMGDVNLDMNHVGTTTDTCVDRVAEMLIDQANHSNMSCMEHNSMDLEFVHSDLGHSADFNIDNSSMFGMADTGIAEREDCEYLFTDSVCFDDNNTGTDQPNESGMVAVPGPGKRNLYKDLGLKLQVIPLNSLHYVSTIQTSKGLHILAIPSQTSVSPSYDGSSVNHSDQKIKMCSEQSTHPSLENTSINQMQTKSDVNVHIDTGVHSRLLLEGSNKQTCRNSQFMKNTTCHVSTKFNQGSILSKYNKKLKHSNDRRLIICRNGTFNKKCFRKVLKRHKIIPKSKMCIDVKSDPLKKHRMVSLLKNSMTNKLKQKQNQEVVNATKEVKLTFHLKPTSGTYKTPNVKQRTLIRETISSTLSETDRAFKENQSALKTITSSETDKISKEIQSILLDMPTNSSLPIIVDNEMELMRNSACCIPEDTCLSFKRSIIVDKSAATFEVDVSTDMHASSKLFNDDDQACEDAVVENSKQENDSVLLIDSVCDILKTSSTLCTRNRRDVRYVCNICFSTFYRAGHFRNHLKMHAEIAAMSKVTLGGKNINESEHQHMNSDKEVYCVNKELCCNKDFIATHATMSDSQKNTEHLTSTIRCEFCGMVFKTRGNLTRHKLTHNLESKTQVPGRYHCDVCSKCFMQKCDLKRHTGTHIGIYPYTCSICSKGFIRKNDLVVHEKFHSQEKRFNCTVCTKTYFQSGDLSRHIRRNHRDLCEFSCHHCGEKYSSQKSMNLHVKNKH